MDLSLLLQDRFGFQEFRPAQKQVIDKVMAGENVLAVMPTGSGKSLCYQLPALALPGLTVVVSPLIALMKDQVDQLSRLALPATVINSTVSREQQRSRLEQAIAGRIKLLFLAPERFQNDEFRARLAQTRVSLFAVDEAHCISLWGHDFRPDYLRLRHVVAQLKSPPVLALTATATPMVRRDILTQLEVARATPIVSGLDRPTLYAAGRDGDLARCLLLFNYADKWIPEFFIDSSHPPADILKYVFAKLCRAGSREIVGESWRRISTTRDHRFHASIALLSRFGYLEKIQNQQDRGVRILKREDPSLEGINFQELEARRQFEYKKFGVMLKYASRFRKHCYRSFILSYFGEWNRNRDCGNCSRCEPQKFPRGARVEVPAAAPSLVTEQTSRLQAQ